jgi:hypothetical protein
MGNSLKTNSTKIGIGLFVLIISGFIVIKYKFFKKKDNKNEKNNADEDRQCIGQTRGKVKNNI